MTPRATAYKRKLLRSTWHGMIRRCHNQRAPGFRHYGARGIVVCAEWRASFEAFERDMGPKPSPAHSIDRIDNDGPYSPENCRWATLKEQTENRRGRWYIGEGVERIAAADLARDQGVSWTCLVLRKRNGWSDADLLKGSKDGFPPVRRLTSAEIGDIATRFASGCDRKELAREYGIGLATVYRVGWRARSRSESDSMEAAS